MTRNLPIVACFVGGIAAGRLYAPAADASAATGIVLYLLLFLVGVSVGTDAGSWSALREARSRALLIPGSALVGTLGGAVLFGLLDDAANVPDSIAVGFGLGYYSLSSILIDRLRGGELAAVALLANVFREVFTIATAGALHRIFGPLAPIASGGATSMDTTLPAILSVSGRQYAVLSVFNGAALTLLVPVLVSFAMSL